MLSGLNRGPQWVIGSCGGADIAIKPMSRGMGSDSKRVCVCVFMYLKPAIALRKQTFASRTRGAPNSTYHFAFCYSQQYLHMSCVDWVCVSLLLFWSERFLFPV